MKFLTVTDTFGPALHSAVSKGQDKLVKVQDKNSGNCTSEHHQRNSYSEIQIQLAGTLRNNQKEKSKKRKVSFDVD